MKKALVTGCTGQIGSFLVEFLISKGYEVHGIIRRSSLFNTSRIDHIFQTEEELKQLHYGDLQDGSSLQRVIDLVEPDEIYNLGAQSHVRVSFDMPEYTYDVVALGALRLLECVRRYKERTNKDIKIYQASSSEMFGNSPAMQDEKTRFAPCSPYAVAKLAAHNMVDTYRKSYGMYAVGGILFNTESERRTETFVTRKITRAATRIKEGLQDHLYLGNLDAKRDWGSAIDNCEAIWLMLQQENPDDYCIATGKSYTVREFCDIVFTLLDLDYTKYVKIDPRYYRPAEVNHLQGNSEKAHKYLNWYPRTPFIELVKTMIAHDLNLARKELLLSKTNFEDNNLVGFCKG